MSCLPPPSPYRKRLLRLPCAGREEEKEKAAGRSTRALISYFPEKPGREKCRIRQPNEEGRENPFRGG